MSEPSSRDSSRSTGSGSWELTKENIQPLSSGRRMADIHESLPVRMAMGFEDQQRYEEHHLLEISKLEQLADNKMNVDPDPLQNYLTLIKYFQNHFPNMTAKVKSRNRDIIKNTVIKFHKMSRYDNDERYANLYITGINSMKTLHQIETLNKFLDAGKGVLVSDVYVRLAELYKGEGNTKKASDILNRGININAQPREKLVEMLTHIQESWAKDYAKLLKSGGTDTEETERGFAKAVPIYGENNEAVSIRQNLVPAAPTNTTASTNVSTRQHNNGATEKFNLYNEAVEPATTKGSESQQSTVKGHNVAYKRHISALETKVTDSENKLEAGRWNTKHNELQNPVIPQPMQKIKLFADFDSVAASSHTSSSVKSHKALQERKEDLCPLPADLPIIPKKEPGCEQAQVSQAEVCIMTTESGTDRIVEENRNLTEVDGYDMKTAYSLYKDRGDFYEGEIKYNDHTIPNDSSRMMEKCKRYMIGHKEWKERKAGSKELIELRHKVGELMASNQILSRRLDELSEQHQVILKQKLQRIADLEAQNDDLLNKLTASTTSNNLQDTLLQRTQIEKQTLEVTVANLRQQLEDERVHHLEELQQLKRKGDESARQSDLGLKKRVKQHVEEEETEIHPQSCVDRAKKQSFVNISVCSRNATEVYSPASPSTTTDTDQGTGESSRFRSGDTIVEPQSGLEEKQSRIDQSVIGSSFMPDLGNDGEQSLFGTQVATSLQPRKALAMVERPLEKNMMNVTPATGNTELDFEIPPPCFGSMGLNRPSRAFNLYQSISDSMSAGPSSYRVGSAARDDQSVIRGNYRRGDVVKHLQMLSENMPPPKTPIPVVPTLTCDENVPPQIFRSEISLENVRTEEETQFRRPALPSDENSQPTLPKPRRSMLLGRPLRPAKEIDTSDSDDDDDVILRRHQQTGVDLNVSNLTQALATGPRPLINSTPERERTLRERDIASLPPRNLSLMPQHTIDTEETPVTDCRGTIARGAVSRYSLLNEPPLNLSTIQETSRENRSRSTTSSSSGGYTMSSTRFGGTASCSAHLYGNTTTRSSSIPRSASRSNSSQNPNNNGYYSDTNAQH